MAEAAVGVVASGAGLAGLTGQIVDGLVKVKRFYDEYKEAPDDMKDTIFEIENLLDTLREINEDQEQHPVQSSNLTRCLTSCEMATKKFSDLAQELDTLMASRRRVGAFKTVLKRDKLAKYGDRVEKAKITLCMSYGHYSRYVTRYCPMKAYRMRLRVGPDCQGSRRKRHLGTTLIYVQRTGSRGSKAASTSNRTRPGRRKGYATNCYGVPGRFKGYATDCHEGRGTVANIAWPQFSGNS